MKQNITQITTSKDINSLRANINLLETELLLAENEKVEIDKIIYEFEVRHNQEVGELLQKILCLKAERLKKETELNGGKRKEFEKAENDYREYTNIMKQEKTYLILSQNEKDEIKSLFRNASKMCHPDRVVDSQKDEASITFQSLRNAYEQNNLLVVKKIYEDLQNGLFVIRNESENKIEILKNLVNQLKIKIEQIKSEIHDLKSTNTFQTIVRIKDWNIYFNEVKKQLTQELNHIQNGS